MQVHVPAQVFTKVGFSGMVDSLGYDLIRFDII